MLFVTANSYMELPTKSLKNCTSKFTLKKQIKSHLLASQSQQFFNYILIYFSLSSSPNYFRFFFARLAMLPYGLDSILPYYLQTCYPSHLYFYYCANCIFCILVHKMYYCIKTGRINPQKHFTRGNLSWNTR